MSVHGFMCLVPCCSKAIFVIQTGAGVRSTSRIEVKHKEARELLIFRERVPSLSCRGNNVTALWLALYNGCKAFGDSSICGFVVSCLRACKATCGILTQKMLQGLCQCFGETLIKKPIQDA